MHFQKCRLETTNAHTFTVKSNIQIVINTKYVIKARKRMYLAQLCRFLVWVLLEAVELGVLQSSFQVREIHGQPSPLEV